MGRESTINEDTVYLLELLSASTSRDCGKGIKVHISYEISAIILSFMDPLAHTNGTTNGDAIVESPAAFDPLIFRKYLLSLLPPVIAADPVDLDTLFVDEFDERVGRFATEAGGVIYIVKIKNEAEGERVVLW